MNMTAGDTVHLCKNKKCTSATKTASNHREHPPFFVHTLWYTENTGRKGEREGERERGREEVERGEEGEGRE